MIKLYDYVLSASCYKVRLMAALVGVKMDHEAVDFHPGRAHKSVEFAQLNPAGTLPVMVDGAMILTESTAMLVYLAKRAGPQWLGPDDAKSAAQVQQWLAFSGRLAASLGMARLHDMLLYKGDIDAWRAQGHAALRELEAALTERRFAGGEWLVGDTPSIADIACFPNAALSQDGGVSLDAYPSVRLWTRRIRALDRFIEMPGIHRLHELSPTPKVA